MSLILLYDLGAISPECIPAVDTVFQGIPGNGEPSKRTGEAFTCRIWAKDTLMALQAEGIIILSYDIGASNSPRLLLVIHTDYSKDIIEAEAVSEAGRYEKSVETGGKARVVLS